MIYLEGVYREVQKLRTSGEREANTLTAADLHHIVQPSSIPHVERRRLTRIVPRGLPLAPRP
jgi:hypothetical protein